MEESNLYRTLGELVAEVRELRRTIESNATRTDARLTKIEEDINDLKGWRESIKGAVWGARIAWLAGGAGGATALGALLTQLINK